MRDLRCNRPSEPYEQLEPKMAFIQRNGDAAARALVRFSEISESLHLIQKIIRDLPQGSIADTTCSGLRQARIQLD
ncbi:MAG: hypothetical protein IPI21_15505 [Propionivibrio sp.]|nr:hypothetical protein [Propionivibrio sp.]